MRLAKTLLIVAISMLIIVTGCKSESSQSKSMEDGSSGKYAQYEEAKKNSMPVVIGFFAPG